MNSGLQLIDLEIKLGNQALISLSTNVEPGEVLTIMGPSGSGKSTLLAALTGTLNPAFRQSGRILLNGTDITRQTPQQRRIAILYQDDLLFPHMSVAENLAFALPAVIQPRSQREARITDALAEMDLAGFGPRNPATLSGGQRARVALARCLLSQPKALLLDEPFSRLDIDLRQQIRTLVFDHAHSRALPVILVTHDPADATAAGGRVLSPLGLPKEI
ncbi:MAG: ATP-binding cassette domain-containing protein [Paracoccaceae bacterium]